MSKVDWSLAPEGATHFNRTGKFFKFDVIGSVGIAHTYSEGKWRSIGYLLEEYSEPGELTARPKPATWSGPQDGLPPVGTVCELSESVLLAGSETSDWFEAGTKVEVGGHAIFCGATGPVCVICVVDENFTGTITEGCLRPSNTAEQLAAEQRETAIREIMDVVGIDCRVTAAKLVDAGFKREVV